MLCFVNLLFIWNSVFFSKTKKYRAEFEVVIEFFQQKPLICITNYDNHQEYKN